MKSERPHRRIVMKVLSASGTPAWLGRGEKLAWRSVTAGMRSLKFAGCLVDN